MHEKLVALLTDGIEDEPKGRVHVSPLAHGHRLNVALTMLETMSPRWDKPRGSGLFGDYTHGPEALCSANMNQ